MLCDPLSRSSWWGVIVTCSRTRTWSRASLNSCLFLMMSFIRVLTLLLLNQFFCLVPQSTAPQWNRAIHIQGGPFPAQKANLMIPLLGDSNSTRLAIRINHCWLHRWGKIALRRHLKDRRVCFVSRFEGTVLHGREVTGQAREAVGHIAHSVWKQSGGGTAAWVSLGLQPMRCRCFISLAPVLEYPPRATGVFPW